MHWHRSQGAWGWGHVIPLLQIAGHTIHCVLFWVVFLYSSPSVLWCCLLGLLTCKNRLPYNLYCVGGDVKHCTIQSVKSCKCRWWSYKLVNHAFAGNRRRRGGATENARPESDNVAPNQTEEPTSSYASVWIDVLKSRHWRLSKSAIAHVGANCGTRWCTFWNIFTYSSVVFRDISA